MYTKSLFTISALLAAAVSAVPLNGKRDLIYVTETKVRVITDVVTQTVWLEAGETAPHSSRPHNHSHHGYHSSGSSAAASAPAYHSPVAATTSAYSSLATAPSSLQPAPVQSSSVYNSPAPAPASSSHTLSAPASSSSVPPAPSPSSETSSAPAPAPTTSSLEQTSSYAAPTSSSSAPASSSESMPTSSYVAPTSTSAASSTATSAYGTPSSPSSGSSGLSGGLAASGAQYSGDLTWYDTGLGACGWNSGSNDDIVAISETIFDSYNTGNPNNNPLCGKTLTITGADGSEYTAKIVDRCPGCAKADLDLSHGFFNRVTNNGDGRVHNMKWRMD
ncbi:hypothetical protein K470DRAFT_254427 [Piedraia hortae CBS 480.64]|uniref:RlpA-like protein double-psi beta-barrel domain-containing protein n=1 Tax=Piedraia hortae CBS 480.64 TaxID=1314780 RepID=A0A6A7CA12_9PEZI|nr:hypothetical protein K470DRAFT_254427 [Piedraia hortae CBS 480.64]